MTLGPVNEAFTVRKIQLLFGGGGTAKDVTVRVYSDDSGATEPGAMLFEQDFTLQAADDAMQELDLNGENVSHSGAGSIRVMVLFNHTRLSERARARLLQADMEDVRGVTAPAAIGGDASTRPSPSFRSATKVPSGHVHGILGSRGSCRRRRD